MLGSFAIILFILLQALLFLFTVSVVYHFRRYGLSSSQKKKFLSVFLVISLLFFSVNFIIFSQIPWQKISERLSQAMGNIF